MNQVTMQYEPRDFSIALQIALKVHGQQVDKAGEPYILHPLRVAMKFDSTFLQIIALLHDVLEDAQEQDRVMVEAEIRGYFNDSLLAIIRHLSRGEENYEQYIEEIGRSLPMVRAVKLADLEDNLDPVRWARSGFTPPRLQRLRYEWARWYLRRATIHAERSLDSQMGLCKTSDILSADKRVVSEEVR